MSAVTASFESSICRALHTQRSPRLLRGGVALALGGRQRQLRVRQAAVLGGGHVLIHLHSDSSFASSPMHTLAHMLRMHDANLWCPC